MFRKIFAVGGLAVAATASTMITSPSAFSAEISASAPAGAVPARASATSDQSNLVQLAYHHHHHHHHSSQAVNVNVNTNTGGGGSSQPFIYNPVEPVNMGSTGPSKVCSIGPITGGPTIGAPLGTTVGGGIGPIC